MAQQGTDTGAPLGEMPAPASKDSDGADGVATSLQPGGMIPGGGPGATVGSNGTGGGSNANEATGDAAENNINEEVK